MNFIDIKTLDIANGPGCRISLFVSGCNHHCKGCFNPESWDFNAGKEFTMEEENKIIDLLSPTYISGLTVLGGEPMDPRNTERVYEFLQHVRQVYPDKSIWVYSGYTIYELMKRPGSRKILKLIDVLVDGEFVEDLKDINLQYCGSTNQSIIDIHKSDFNSVEPLIYQHNAYRFTDGFYKFGDRTDKEFLEACKDM